MNNPPQVRGDYSTQGSRGYWHVLRRAED